MALGLVHHLMHEENLSLHKIFAFLSSLIKKNGYMIIEYISEEDPRHRLIKNVNYPHSLGYEDLERVVIENAAIVSQIQVSEFRTLYLIKK
jgi:hypothetical protein